MRRLSVHSKVRVVKKQAAFGEERILKRKILRGKTCTHTWAANRVRTWQHSTNISNPFFSDSCFLPARIWNSNHWNEKTPRVVSACSQRHQRGCRRPWILLLPSSWGNDKQQEYKTRQKGVWKWGGKDAEHTIAYLTENLVWSFLWLPHRLHPEFQSWNQLQTSARAATITGKQGTEANPTQHASGKNSVPALPVHAPPSHFCEP